VSHLISTTQYREQQRGATETPQQANLAVTKFSTTRHRASNELTWTVALLNVGPDAATM
jgi:hypothetical protein